MAIGIGEVTQGYSATGAEDFKRALQKQAIEETANKLGEINGIKTALEAGWQGDAQLNFVKNLEKAITETQQALREMNATLDGQFATLQEAWAEQDKNMVPIE